MAKTPEELRTIELGLAYLAASSILDSALLFAESEAYADADQYLDMYVFADEDEADAEGVEEAVAYLDSRGLIDRHPSNANWIQVRDESEPLVEPAALGDRQTLLLKYGFALGRLGRIRALLHRYLSSGEESPMYAEFHEWLEADTDSLSDVKAGA